MVLLEVIGSMVRINGWNFTYFEMGYSLGLLTHLLSIDPNFQQDIQKGSPSVSCVIAIG